MTWLEWTAAMADALAWPVAVLIVVLVFRERLAELLRRLARVKAAGVEADFGLLEARADRAELAPPERAGEELATLEALAPIDPGSAVDEARFALVRAWERAKDHGPFETTDQRLKERRQTWHGIKSALEAFADKVDRGENEVAPARALAFVKLTRRLIASIPELYPET